MSEPTVGCMVHFHPHGEFKDQGIGPWAALVVAVKDPRCVNLVVFTPDGNLHPIPSVSVIQEGDPVPEANYCCSTEHHAKKAEKPEEAPKSHGAHASHAAHSPKHASKD